MSMHRKTISLTEQQDGWKNARVESVLVGDGSEHVRDLIPRDQQAKERLATLRQVLAEGESSGEPIQLDLSAIKATGRKRIKMAD